MTPESPALDTPALTDEVILHDFQQLMLSRHLSLIGRREVMSGKAKFGVFGDGKELAQIALAKAFQPGDFRAGYYRDQTLAFVLGLVTPDQFFAQVFGHPDVEADPMMGGRSMNNHYATRWLNADGSWRNQTALINFTADLAPTAAQMPRLVGLAYASRLYRHLPELRPFSQFSNRGNEVAFGIIGNASTAEGMFWEAVNAIGVLHAPAVISIWDDGYGISVSNDHQLTKGDVGALLTGFQRAPNSEAGFDVYTVKGWDYPALVETYARATANARRHHIPAIVHVVELTQPQGHSTSGSHERYKSAARLEWEREHDCLRQFRHWIVNNGYASEKDLEAIDRDTRQHAEAARARAWEAHTHAIREEQREVADLLDEVAPLSSCSDDLLKLKDRLLNAPIPFRRDIHTTLRQAMLALRDDPPPVRQVMVHWRNQHEARQQRRYGSHLHSEGPDAALNVPEIPARYSERSPELHGFEVLNACFDAMLARDPRVLAFGEDVGQLGDVNQGFAGLQAKHGAWRVSDTGIREATILGQALGLAQRGLRPIAEIQYLDYILYALQLISDDLASLRWRTVGGQKAPVIIRTRGHRLEGIWHSGSPMAGILNLVRGVYLCVPRNMTQAAGFYNTLLKGDDPAIVVEPLNGYRLKERKPDNLAEFTVPLGVPEIIRPGTDITVVTYGSMCRIALEAAHQLAQVGVQAEVIDVRTLLPFDRLGLIGESLKKTNRILFLDEDVPGGATAYMFQQVLEGQGGYRHLDSEPRTLSAQAHRPAYGSDGDYWSKPNVETVFDAVYTLMHEADPASYPLFYK